MHIFILPHWSSNLLKTHRLILHAFLLYFLSCMCGWNKFEQMGHSFIHLYIPSLLPSVPNFLPHSLRSATVAIEATGTNNYHFEVAAPASTHSWCFADQKHFFFQPFMWELLHKASTTLQLLWHLSCHGCCKVTPTSGDWTMQIEHTESILLYNWSCAVSCNVTCCTSLVVLQHNQHSLFKVSMLLCPCLLHLPTSVSFNFAFSFSHLTCLFLFSFITHFLLALEPLRRALWAYSWPFLCSS